MSAFVKIGGKIQDYQWGGYHFIPETLKIETADYTKPSAEYWLGTHSAAPSHTVPGQVALDQYLADHSAPPLQFLFKVLDVKEMLSIQSHPTRQQAVAGFDRENALGIDLKAKNRNYKDDSDKPELMLALSEFWLLHGLSPIEKTRELLSKYHFLSPLQEVLNSKGLAEAFAYGLDDNNPRVVKMCQQFAEHVTSTSCNYTKNDIEYWVRQWVDTNPGIYKGLLTLLFLNIVKLEQGQAIYQPAGLLHAYLKGQNIELMANSDNVLRAGLTPKHIDVEELLNTCTLTPTEPDDFLITARAQDDGSIAYPTPFEAFQLDELRHNAEFTTQWHSQSPELLFCYQGRVTLYNNQDSLCLEQGQAALILPNTSIHALLESARVFRAKNL